MDLEQKLAQEKFNGQINWTPEMRWSGIPIQVAETEKEYFYKQGGRIYVQSKNGPIQKRIPYCYKCHTEIKVIATRVQNHQPGTVCGKGTVDVEYRFYCETCNDNPPLNIIGQAMKIKIVT